MIDTDSAVFIGLFFLQNLLAILILLVPLMIFKRWLRW